MDWAPVGAPAPENGAGRLVCTTNGPLAVGDVDAVLEGVLLVVGRPERVAVGDLVDGHDARRAAGGHLGRRRSRSS